MKLSEMTPTGRFFGMFVGDSGAGKTCAALSFPTPGLLIDVDLRAKGGLLAKKWIKNFGDWDVIQVPPGKGFADIDNKLEQLDRELKDKTNVIPKTIVIDSLTSLSRLFVSDAVQMNTPDNRGNPQPTMKGKILGNLRLPGPVHYGYEQEAMAQIIDYLKSWPMNVICSAHIIQKWGKAEGASEYSDNVVIGEELALRPRVAVRTLLHFDEVYRFSKVKSANKIKHAVEFQDGDLAKTSYGDKLPDKAIEVTCQDFYSIWSTYINREVSK